MLARAAALCIVLTSLLSITAVAQPAPTITSISPTVGPASPVGSPITIKGSGFGASQGSGGTVSVGGLNATPSFWSDTKITVPVPSALLPGSADVIVTVSGVASNAKSFFVISVVTGISPSSAPVGDLVTLTGTSFGDTQQAGNGTVVFNGIPAKPTAWSNTSITFPIPVGASSGSIVLTVNGFAYNTGLYLVSPKIDAISPPSSPVNSPITLTGSGFGASQNFNPVTIGGIAATPSSWSDTAIAVPVPATVPAGNAGAAVTVNGVASNAASFVVTPFIAGLSANSGPVGASITLTGTSFGSSSTGNSVMFNGSPASPSTWNDTSIVVGVPPGATTGLLLVTVNGALSNGLTFTITTPVPVITLLSATSGLPGDAVTISGSGFGSPQPTSTVTFGGVVAAYTSWTDGAIAVTVPNGAVTGDVVVTVAGQASNAISFAVLNGLLSGQLRPTVTAVTLTSPIALDWEHWGTAPDSLLVRKTNGTPLLTDFSPIGTNAPVIFSDGEIEYLWTDGDVVNAAERTTTGVSISGAGNGFHLSVPADVTARTLVLYIGASSAQAQLKATLSDSSSVPYIDAALNAAQGNELNGTYSIDFKAGQPGQALNIDYTLLTDHGNGQTAIGQVTLQSAQLLPHLPAININSPTDGQVFSYPSDISVAATASQIDTALVKVDFFSDSANPREVTASPYSSTFSGLTPGDHLLTATATDAAGLSATSDPVLVAEVQANGSLTASIDSPTNVDLSAGTSDWVHWGNSISLNTIDRKAGVPPQISDFVTFANGAFYTSDDTGRGSISYSWSGGTPTASQAGTGTQVFMQGFKNGFQLTIPADTTPRTAKLYLGYGFSASRLRASLSDGSANPWTNDFSTTDFYQERVITFQFQAASAGQTLIIRDQVTGDFGFGYVDLEAATVSDQNPPAILSVSPASGSQGTQLTISGSNFGSQTGAVTLNGVPLTVNSWSDGTITATLTGGYTSGSLVASRGLASSNSVPFVYAGPIITSLVPNAGPPGTIVSIQGQGLGNDQSTVTVTFGGVPANVVSHNGTSIQTAVPAGLSFAPAQVGAQVQGQPTNSLQFDVVQPPVLTALTPNFGVTDQVVKIFGTNFGLLQANSSVFFGDIPAQPILWSESLIETRVPAGFYGGIVQVVVGGQVSNGLPFEVPLRCLTNCNAQTSAISLSPQNLSVVVGDQVDLGVANNLGETVPYANFTLSDPTLGTISTSGATTTFTALAPGTLTVTATSGSFNSSTTIRIYAGPTLPDGTIKWQMPASLVGTAAANFVQAQPAPNSATATFVEDLSNPHQNVIIRALDVNGRELWAWPTGTSYHTLFFNPVAPTPSGGFVFTTEFSINSIDANGHPLWSYSYPQLQAQPLTVGYDGTVYALVDFDFSSNEDATHLVALDGVKGTEKFRVPLPHGRGAVSGTANNINCSYLCWPFLGNPPTHDSDGPSQAIFSRPMVLADGSVNVAAWTRHVTETFTPNSKQANPICSSVDLNFGGDGCTATIYCPVELVECWAATQNQLHTTEGQEVDLVNVQPDGTYHQYELSQNQVDCDWFGFHYLWVLDDQNGTAAGLFHDINGRTQSDGHKYVNNGGYWSQGTCGTLPPGPNGFDLMVVPNGSGGVLVASETNDPQNPVWIKNIAQPSSSGDGTEISIASLNTLNRLVIGENGTAFAAGTWNFYETPRLVSFNLAGGTNWTYDSSFGTPDEPGYVDIIAAGPNNSLYAVEGDLFNQEPKVAFTLDGTGSRTDNPISNQQLTFLASAALGSSTWLGANEPPMVASLGGTGMPFGTMPLVQSGIPANPAGITAYVATLVTPALSTFAASFTNGAEHIPVDSITNRKVAELLTRAMWSNFGKSHCGAVFADSRAFIAVPNYSLIVVQDKQRLTNFYDIGFSDVASLTVKEVTGRQIFNSQTLINRLGNALADTENMGFSRQTAVILKKDFFSLPTAKFTLVHEVLLHAYAAESDDQVFRTDFLLGKGLWRPADSTATTNITTWMSTDCRCTPGNPATPACQANTAKW